MTLVPELKAALVTTSTGLQILRHRFVTTIYAEQMDAQYNEMLEHKRQRVAAALAERNLDSYVWLHERPFRLNALIEYIGTVGSNAIEPEELAAAISSAWSDAESPSINQASWLFLFSQYVRNSSIGEAARAYAKALPHGLFRGTVASEKFPGMSWTADRELAEWFARRNAGFDKKKKPVLYSVVPTDSEILASYHERNESEFILDPRRTRRNPTLTRETLGKETRNVSK